MKPYIVENDFPAVRPWLTHDPGEAGNNSIISGTKHSTRAGKRNGFMTDIPVNSHNKEQKNPQPGAAEPEATVASTGENSVADEATETMKESSPDTEADTLRKELEASRAEAAANYDRYVRLAAELENFRRRSAKEKTDLQKFGIESFCKALLPVLDSFDRATAEFNSQQEKDESASLAEGIMMVKKQLMETLEKQGLATIDAVGSPFDPNLHQAIRKVEDADVKEELVKEEYSKGYLLNDRLIRPAMVSVAVPQEG